MLATKSYLSCYTCILISLLLLPPRLQIVIAEVNKGNRRGLDRLGQGHALRVADCRCINALLELILLLFDVLHLLAFLADAGDVVLLFVQFQLGLYGVLQAALFDADPPLVMLLGINIEL